MFRLNTLPCLSIIFWLLLSSILSSAQDSLNISLISRLPFSWHGMGDIALSDADIAYVAAGPFGIRFIDISDVDNPREINWYITSGEVRDLLWEDDILYFNDYWVWNNACYFKIMDVSNPQSPRLLSELDLDYNYYFNIAKYQDYCYLPMDEQGTGFYVVDVSDAQNPFIAAEIGAYEQLNDIFVAGNYAFTAEGTTYSFARGLGTFDLTDPEHPLAVGWCELTSAVYPFSVFADSNYAYLAGNYLDIAVFDISNPENPVLQGIIYGNISDFKQIFVEHQTAYIANDYISLLIIDVSNPSQPELLQEYYTSSLYSVIAQNDTVYLSTFQILNTADPQNIQVISYLSPNDLREIAVQDSIAYLGFLYGGFEIVDVSDAQNPLILSCVNNNGSMFYVYDLYLEGNLLYVSHHQSQQTNLRIYDISNPVIPVELGCTATHQFPEEMVVSYGYCYLAASNWIQIFEVTDPHNPQLCISFNSSSISYPKSLDISGDDLFTAHSDGLAVIDVSVPENPFVVDTIDMSSYANGNDVIADGNVVYFASTIGLHIYDASTPSALQELSFLPLANPKYLFKEQDHIIASRGDRIYVINVEDPVNPFVTGFYGIDCFEAYETDVTGNLLYRAEISALGIYNIEASLPVDNNNLQTDTPGNFTLFPPYPNPFNNRATITFSLPVSGKVRLAVYDVLGREIQVLCAGDWEPGKHSIIWKAEECASGIYFVKLKTEGRSSMVRKIVLMK